MNIQQKKLKNGLKIIVVPMKDSPTATVLTMVSTGSEYETKAESGMSHFLEHMCFKGTTKRPRSIDISHELDSLGAQNNAFTGNEYTGYYAKAHSKQVNKLIEIISDLYLNPTFPAVELEREKGVIIEEMNMYEDLPQRKVHEVFSTLLHGDQPAGRPILGDKKIIQNAKREDFVTYRKKHYGANKTTVIVAGNVNAKNTFRLIEKYFGSIDDSSKSKKEKVRESQKSPKIKILQKKTDQTHLVLGVRTFPVSDKRNTVLQVLDGVLGQGMSSRLFQKLREEMGVCYYAKSSANQFTDHGDFVVFAGVDTKRVVEVVSAILDEFRRLRDELVSGAELSKVKESLMGSLYMGLESSDEVASFIGEQELIRKEIKTPQEIERKIRAVRPEDIRKLAREIFTDKKLNLAIVGNVKSGKKIKSMLKI